MGNIFRKVHGYMCPIHLSLYLMLGKLYNLVAFLYYMSIECPLLYNSDLLHFAIVAAQLTLCLQFKSMFVIKSFWQSSVKET